MNKNIFSISFLGMMIFLLGACDSSPFEGKDDPLYKKSQDIKNGIPPKGEEEVKEKPLAQDVLLIDAADFYVFREGIEQEITITSRTLFDDAVYEFEVVNLGDFLGAKVEYTPGDKKANIPASIKMTWKPPVGFAIQDKLVYGMDLTLATKNYSENYIHKKSVPLLVYNESFAVPQIVSINQVPLNMKEKDAAKVFNVLVKDVDARDVDGFRPSLMFMSKNLGGLNISPFLKIKRTALVDVTKAQWLLEVEVNLSGLELTANSTTGYFDIAAVSANGIKSNPMSQSIAVWTSVALPLSSWNSEIQFKIGTENRYTFTVIDPKSEGKLSTNFDTQCSSLSPDLNCSCQSSTLVGSSSSASVCSIVWNVASTELPRAVQISYTAKNQSPIFGDSENKVSPFTNTIQLVK